MPLLPAHLWQVLSAQLWAELKAFFPNNAVEYFVSYYDYFRPESYEPTADVYLQKSSAVNEDLDALRHSATSALLSRVTNCVPSTLTNWAMSPSSISSSSLSHV